MKRHLLVMLFVVLAALSSAHGEETLFDRDIPVVRLSATTG